MSLLSYTERLLKITRQTTYHIKEEQRLIKIRILLSVLDDC